MWVLPKNILKRSNWAAGVQHVPYGHCTKLVFSLFIPVVHKKIHPLGYYHHENACQDRCSFNLFYLSNILIKFKMASKTSKNMFHQVLVWFWAKKLNFEKVLRFKLRWKIMIPLSSRSENQILLSNIGTLMKIRPRKSWII